MRLNKYLASSTSLSRRSADVAIDAGRVTVNGTTAVKGTEVDQTSQVKLDGTILTPTTVHTTIILNKPVGYVCSRNGQGSQTVYDLLPAIYHCLNPVGRLDKDSSGLLLMSDDGELANQLTHPRYAKTKVYEVTLDKPLQPLHQQMITDHGITLEDGLSRFLVTRIGEPVRSTGASEQRAGGGGLVSSEATIPPEGRRASLDQKNVSTEHYQITMQEGRNRQIRRTFAALGYHITSLHRTHFGPYSLGDLAIGSLRQAYA
ncbi:MAG: pseudouridine synthase [Candidatus Saccharimonadales bacterium]